MLLVAVARNSTLTDISHQTIQLHLRLIGASIYEYHTKTGRWPARLDDWAETSLPRESPHWKVMIESGADVMVWHDNLNSDPKDNAHLILAYHNKGLLAWLGRQWVCWGDLRTEYVRTRKLGALLQTGQ